MSEFVQPKTSVQEIWYKDIYHLGLDELEIYATFLLPEVFEWVDFDNSNYIEFDWYIVTKHEVPKYKEKYTFAKDGIPMFAYYIWKEKSEKVWVATKDYFCAYGSSFRHLWKLWVFDFFYKYFSQENETPIKRADICIDLLIDINSIISRLDPDIQTENIFKKKWKLETFYIWEKQKTNKRYLIRIYDKIRDIKKKKKYTLYSEYLSNKDVTRVELEIRRELTRQATLVDFYNEEIFMRIFKNYLRLHTNVFEFLEWDVKNLTKKREKIDFTLIQSQAYQEQRAKLLIAYAKGLYSFGMCPVEILLQEELIQEPTKHGLWYEKYTKYMLDLKRLERHSYKRNYALWKEEEEVKSLMQSIDKIFPNDPN